MCAVSERAKPEMEVGGSVSMMTGFLCRCLPCHVAPVLADFGTKF